MKILVIEDTLNIREELKHNLLSEGFEVETIIDFTKVNSQIEKICADLILMDIGLPNEDGYRILRELRKKNSTPVIILTSRNTEVDELLGMNLGADDFIKKPFNMEILILRINSILKRINKVNNEVININGISFNKAKSRIENSEMKIELSKNELILFTYLIKNRGKIVSRADLMDELWQTDEFVDDNTLSVNINRLRCKILELGLEDFIKTKRGLGYMVE